MARRRQGRFLGLPYDLRKPSRERVRSRWWNKSDSRVFVPKVFGWGYGVNFAALFARVAALFGGARRRS
jgi:hypothetical protein